VVRSKNWFSRKVFRIFAISAASIVLSGLVVYAYFEVMRNLLREEVKQQLMAITVAATFLINSDEHEKIAQAKDTNDLLYQKTIAKLRAFAEQTLPEVREKGIKFAGEKIYTLVPFEGAKWHIILDTTVTHDRDGNGRIEKDEMHASTGEEYDVSGLPELLRCFQEARPTAETELTINKWGVWLSGYAPLKDENGKVVAIVGVKMNVENLALKEQWLKQLSLIIFVAVSLTISLLALFLYRRRIAYEQLSRTEELQRKLVDVSADLIFSLKPDGTIISVSAQIRSYGYEPNSLIGHPITELITFEGSYEFDDLSTRLKEKEITQTCNVSIRTARGRIIQGEWRCFGVYEDGNLVEIWGVFHDLSQLLLLTKELKNKANELSKLSEEQSRLLDDIRRQAERLSVLDELVLAAMRRSEIVSSAQVVVDGLKSLFPETALAVFQYDSSSKSLKLLASDERMLKAIIHLFSDPKQPISAESFPNFHLLQSGKEVRLDNLADTDSEIGRLLAAEGYHFAVAFPFHVGGDFLGFLSAFRSRPPSFTEEEFTFLQRVANHLSIVIYNAKLFEELKRAYEELKQAQAMLIQQERLSALGQMASGISHDIGNALVPLLAYSEVLREHPDPKVREWGHQIAIATDDIIHIVQRLRAFYRPRDPNEALEAVDLNGIVKQVVDLTKPRWYGMSQREGITIEMILDLDEKLPSIAGVPTELREALTNLIFNAVDAIVEKGEPEGTIRIRTGRRDSHAFLEVIDTGIGMDEETKRRCLEPFFTTKGEKGSGLGLMMVYGMMQRHEGQIEVESELGKGTTFRLLFPVKETDLGKMEQKKVGEEISPLRILLVDDDPRVTMTLSELLKSWGHTVVTAEDGIKAFDIFVSSIQAKQPFDIVITDLGMPRMNGIELVRKIRDHDQRMPIVIITAWDKESLPLSVEAVLNKPIKSRDLRDALAKIMAQRTRQTEKVS